MSFVSIAFFPFFLSFIFVYYRLDSPRAQNALVIVGSYVFYAYWDWRLLGLLVVSSAMDFWVAQRMDERPDPSRRRRLLWVSVTGNLLLLASFKYFGFFVDSMQRLLFTIGLGSTPMSTLATLEIALPIGISFYTFQTLGYVIDVYRGREAATRDPFLYFAFVSFFPQLVAGPIERAGHLMPQLRTRRTFDRAYLDEGLWYLLSGYFLKVVIADSAAPIVDSVFVDEQSFGFSVILGSALFGLQIYADFHGYTLIARGCARLLGVRLSRNFIFPFWAVSIIEFWRCWHVTLSQWFRDYVYIPLGGNRRGRRGQAVNLLVTAALAGLWHGAAWHFVLWGVMHGLALVVTHNWPGSRLPRPWGWVTTQAFVLFSWLVFRAADTHQLGRLLATLANLEWAVVHSQMVLALVVLALPLVAVESQLRRKGAKSLLGDLDPRWSLLIRASMLASIVVTAQRVHSSFIYFQF